MPSLLLCVVLAPPMAETEAGYTLQPQWQLAWQRILDRTGRPDHDGPTQQRFDVRQYPEYDMDLHVSAFPWAMEHDWRMRDVGGRLWVQSIDEFTFANRVELKARAPMGDIAALGLRFDRLETIETHSDLLAVDFFFDDIAETGAFAGLSFYPRWEKEDSDVNLDLGVRRADLGEAKLSITSLDTFVNASFALAESRDAILDEHVKQVDALMAYALTLRSASAWGARVEAYGGVIPKGRTRHRVPTRPERQRYPNDSARNADRADRAWVWSLRAGYMFGDIAGAEVGYLGSDRAVTGANDPFISGTDHRITTRALLQLGEHVWSSFGIGWDLDRGDGAYDGAGATIVAFW